MGIKKQYLKSKPECKVTFTLPKEAVGGAKKVTLVGEFNDWSETNTPLKKMKNGSVKPRKRWRRCATTAPIAEPRVWRAICAFSSNWPSSMNGNGTLCCSICGTAFPRKIWRTDGTVPPGPFGGGFRQ